MILRSCLAAGVVAAALALTPSASGQVITYAPGPYYNTPVNPVARTYSTAVFYSNYTAPIFVPTYFVEPSFGHQMYGPHWGWAAPNSPTVYPIGYTTYTTMAVPRGGVYYSGDARIPPSAHYYYPYATYGRYYNPFVR